MTAILKWPTARLATGVNHNRLMNDETKVAPTTRRQRTLRHKDRPSLARKTPAAEGCCPTPISFAPSASPTMVLRRVTDSASWHLQQDSKHTSTGEANGMIQAVYIKLRAATPDLSLTADTITVTISRPDSVGRWWPSFWQLTMSATRTDNR